MATENKNETAPEPKGERSRLQMSRRDMLIQGGATLAVTGAAIWGAKKLYDPRGDAGLQPPEPIHLKDYFAKVKDGPALSARLSAAYGKPDSIDSVEKIQEMVTRAVGGLDKSLGMKRFISKGDVVMLKPNVGFDRGPSLGATTNPEVVRAVIRLCKDAGAKRIIVADNPIEDPAACFAKSGIKAAAEA